MKKTETVEEFLARGGKITKVEYKVPELKVEGVKQTSGGGPVTLMTLDDADLYYGEQKLRKVARKKSNSIIDISALPEELRKKYIDEIIYAEENDEDSDEE